MFIIALIGIAAVAVLLSTRDKKFSNEELSEFELINLCHCYEYLELRNLDYIKWEPNGREKFLNDVGNQMFGRYQALNLNSQYFKNRYNNSKFFKMGYSKYLGSNIDFSRLDSLYYEPLIKHYVQKIGKTEVLPYLGVGDVSSFFDCYYRVKEIPLEEEYEIFLDMNNKRNR
jgi:hypothetical protein